LAVESLERLYRDVVRNALRGVNDPELRIQISELVTKLIILIRYGNPELRSSILTLVFDNLPSDVVAQFIEGYLNRTIERYRKIESIAKRIAPQRGGGEYGDIMGILQAMGIDLRSVFDQYVRQKYGVSLNQQQGTEQVQGQLLTTTDEEELKRLVFGSDKDRGGSNVDSNSGGN